MGLCALGLSLLLAACPGSLDDPSRFVGGGGDSGAVDTPCDAPATVFKGKCATSGCHSTADMSGTLDLESPNVGARLREKPSSRTTLLIDPADPDKSVVYTKVLLPPPFGSRMPLGEDPLTDTEIACVRAWVRQEAKGTAAASDAGSVGSVDSAAE
jgi:hypothetical protein